MRYTLVAELEIDTDWYDEKTEKAIKEVEKKNAIEWVFDNVVSEKIVFKKA